MHTPAGMLSLHAATAHCHCTLPLHTATACCARLTTVHRILCVCNAQVSDDLVNWKRVNRTGVKGSSGGGVSLPADGPTRRSNTTAGWNAAVFASVPMYPQNPAVGLTVWHSDDEELLVHTRQHTRKIVLNLASSRLSPSFRFSPSFLSCRAFFSPFLVR